VFRRFASRLVLLCCLGGLAWGEPGGAVAVFGRDPGSLQSLGAELLSARDRLGLDDTKLRVLRVNTSRWTPKDYARFGFTPEDLPLASVVTLNPKGFIARMVGYPDFVERRVVDAPVAADRLLKRWAEAGNVTPAMPLIRATTMYPESDQILVLGHEILVHVQAESGGNATIVTTSGHSAPLREVGAGLYQGIYAVSEGDEGPVRLSVQFVGKNGATEEKPIGHFLAEGFTPPRFLSVLPVGPDVYEVRGSAPPNSIVRAKCHIDMGRFLFIGYPDFDQEWQVQTDANGEFVLPLDLNQATTRRADITLEAQFTAVAVDPKNEARQTPETQFKTPIRMMNYNGNRWW
jgi:hypothetical protein